MLLWTEAEWGCSRCRVTAGGEWGAVYAFCIGWGSFSKAACDLLSFTWSKEKSMLGELVSRLGLLGA